MSVGDSANGINASDPQAGRDLAIWLFFQIAADNIGLPILVATFLFAKSVKRNPTLVNMCITWIVAGVSSSLLLYAGKESGEEPSHALCVFQTSLLFGTPPMCSLSALALIYTVWTSLSCTSADRDSRATNYGMYVLLITPYVALFGFALVTSVVAIQDLQKVNRARRFFYCSVENDPLSDTMAIFSASICLICVLFEVLVAIRIIRAWRAFQSYNNESHRRGFDKQLILRLFIFSGYLIVALFFSAASVRNFKSVVPDMFAASIGMAVFFVFGTQPDVLRAWAFWLPARPPPPPPKDSISVHEPPYHFSPVEKPFSGDRITILSNSEMLQDLSHVHLMQGSPSNTPSLYEYVTPVASSMMSRKGDSVIIIGKPEEAFGALGRGKHYSV